ncbi:hypothetical protein STIUS_v1c01960 [Spiroplasma sp. TIUS-1]|uniref:DUF2075 domain-containing protein n=1 Tax=Spiroplasma sp. TIUS-1 TaxID=216963 RepID=UPI001398A9DF|nr:DUF2075 domain-containing protein [Spiroplasma sp. TIUS-1]QHX35751.1 hypothetical protein STIUS_v1c01960 [Spiroplasma sp. TIUS-1]
MIIYRNTKEGFIKDILNGNTSDIILENFKKHGIAGGGSSEYRSWNNSLEHMNTIISNTLMPNDVMVYIEYGIPSLNKRVDFLISGKSKDNKNTIIFIELKQWQKAEVVLEKHGIVKTALGGGLRETTHPSYQVTSYIDYMKDYSKILSNEEIRLLPCSFLHNYNESKTEPILNVIYKEILDKAPVFFRNDRLEMIKFINENISLSDDSNLFEAIDKEDRKPSKSLIDYAGGMLKGNKEFVLLDTQKVIYEECLLLSKKTNEHKKKVLIIKGGPGTGKTVLAFNLLSTMLRDGLNAKYVSKNSSLRDVFKDKVASNKDIKEFNKSRMNTLLMGSGSFIESNWNEYDCLIVDEAQRLNLKSGMFKNKGENQIKEIINSSRLPIFFVDDNQVVTSSDIGSVDAIVNVAKDINISEEQIIIMELDSQFRLNGSNGYLQWIDNALCIKETPVNILDKNEINYDFRIYDDVLNMYQNVYKLNSKNNKSRVMAGYCWDWKSKNNKTVNDIVIGNFEKQWNHNTTWSIEKNSIDQIGSIHTAQGLEFEYAGVIVGDDLDVVNGALVANFESKAKTDQTLKGLKALIKEGDSEAIKKSSDIIKNTYRVLLTRGMKGTFVYFTNKKVEKYFKELIK